MNKNTLLLIIALLVIIGGAVWLTQKPPQTQVGKTQVMASFYPLYFFAEEIAGDKATVLNLTPEGIEPHDYEPTPQDIAQMQKSKLLLINGAGLEPWLSNVQDDLTNSGVTIVNASEAIALQEGENEDEHTEKTEVAAHEEEAPKDPHVWLSPVLAKSQVKKILAGLITVDPTNKNSYEANAKELQNKLDALDKKYQSGLSNCAQRDFVTSHAAFAYLAKQYNLTMIPIAGLSPEQEPSATQLAEVANFAKQNNVKYIFFETLVSPKLSETVATEIGAKTLVLDPLEGISDDDRKQGKNYFTTMEENLSNLQEALQCSK